MDDEVDQSLDCKQEQEFIQNLIQEVHHKVAQEWFKDELNEKISQSEKMHQEEMLKQTLQLQEFVNKYENCKKLKTENVNEISNQKEELSQLKQKLQTAQNDLEELLRRRETSHETLRKLSVEIKEDEAFLQKEEKTAQEAHSELEEAIKFFCEHLAIQIKKLSDKRLQFIYTCIDQENPEKPFCFCLKINADRSYCVSDCQPPVADFDALSQKLNETNDFKSFVKAMWKRFRLLA